MRFGVLIGVLFLMVGCAQSSTSVSVKLEYGSEADGSQTTSPARVIIEDRPISARVMYRYDGLDEGSWIIEPTRAFPTFVPDGDAKLTLWEKASDVGFDFLNTSFVRVSGVPYRRKNFQMAIEFISEFVPQGETSTDYYVVAYACYSGPTDSGLSEAKFKRDMANGLRIWAGRTCGKCPSGDPDSRDQDHPDFTNSNLPNLTSDDFQCN